jgi:transposase
MRSLAGWTRRVRWSRSGGRGSSRKGLEDWRNSPDAGAQPAFPPGEVIEVKALACELPSQRNIPLSRFSTADIATEAVRRGIVASIGATTVWRWLSADAIRPWAHRTWIFPRDPQFRDKAGRVLDLYEGTWEGKPLSAADCVLSTDEKTSIQARKRRHLTTPPAPGQVMRVEHEYRRSGAWAYLAAWDVRRAKIHGRCEPTTGIEPFGRLVSQVMKKAPYRDAPRVFWIMDNGSSHRGQRCAERLRRKWPNIIAVHTPIHASWLNRVEIFFSIVQRKVLSPNDFTSIDEVASRLIAFQSRYEAAAKPFDWRFTRRDLAVLLRKLGRGPARRVA